MSKSHAWSADHSSWSLTWFCSIFVFGGSSLKERAVVLSAVCSHDCLQLSSSNFHWDFSSPSCHLPPHLPTNTHISNVRTADSSKTSRLLKDCRYSGFQDLVLLSQAKLRYSVDILRWGCCFLVTFPRLSRQRLFHPSIPVWRTSSSQCQFVFHPDDKLNCWESSLLCYSLSRPTRHSWSPWAAAYTLK